MSGGPRDAGTPSPTSYAARTKYDEPGRAERYARRSPRRDALERRLLERVLPSPTEGGTALDVPCGTGRLSSLLLDRGWRVVAADLSPAMRTAAAQTLGGKDGATVEAIDLDAIDAKGYAFQIETTYRALRKGFTVDEVPITFVDREEGGSKMSKAIVAEAIWKVPGLRLAALLGRL